MARFKLTKEEERNSYLSDPRWHLAEKLADQGRFEETVSLVEIINENHGRLW